MKITRIMYSLFLMAALFMVSCAPKDADIKTAVMDKFKADPDIAALSVDVTDGVATISGECKDDACKTKAEATAKDVKGVKSVVDNATMAAPPPPMMQPAPVVISPDDALKQSVMDATKDHPTVNASVNDGVITLTGDIKRDQLQKLMMSLNSLKPKKIENKLTIK